MDARRRAGRARGPRARDRRGPRLGENPENVTTYAQLALLNENDQVKRQIILREHKLAIAKLVEFSVYDIRTYWGASRQIALAGDEEMAAARVFNATTTPPFFIVKVAKGSSKPRSEAAELKKIEELWAAALNSGTVPHDPQAWVEWLKDSLEQGQALDFPDIGSEVHSEQAKLENQLLLNGESVAVTYYEPLEVHIPEHRVAQIEAKLTGDIESWKLIEEHVQQHILVHAESEHTLTQITPPPLPLGMPGEEGDGQQVIPGSPHVAGGGLDPSDPSYVGPQGGGGGGFPMNLTVPLSIDIPPSHISVEPPTVNVGAPIIPAPHISVNVPSVEVQERRVEFTRDDKGRIVSADVTDGKKSG